MILFFWFLPRQAKNKNKTQRRPVVTELVRYRPRHFISDFTPPLHVMCVCIAHCTFILSRLTTYSDHFFVSVIKLGFTFDLA